MVVITTDKKNLNAVAEQILKELSNHNIRISELDQVFEITKAKVYNQVIIKNNDAIHNSTDTVERYKKFIQKEE